MPNETHDNFAPVGVETTAYDLAVDGTIPAELCGTYIRTGPNPTDVAPGEFVIGGLKADGDGMLHGVRLDGGAARWYANRWVRSPELAARFHLPTVPEDAPAGTPDGGRFNGSGNTNVVHHAGRIHALNELSNPYEIAPDLTTRRHENFGGPLPAGMTAHPKFDPDSGEMHVLAYDVFEPVVWYHVVDPGGRLTKGVRVALPASVMVHDMGLTATQVMVMDLPVVFDVDRAMRGEKAGRRRRTCTAGRSTRRPDGSRSTYAMTTTSSSRAPTNAVPDGRIATATPSVRCRAAAAATPPTGASSSSSI